jgi:integrase
MRHTFATWAIEEGSIHLWQLAKIMGTSVAQLEETYARWLKRTDERRVAAFDAYDGANARSTARSAAARAEETGLPESTLS